MQRAPVASAGTANAPRLVQQAIAALDRGDLDAAALLARDAATKAPRDALAWEVLSIALYRRGDLDPAIEAGQKAIALNPKAADFHVNLGAVLRAANRPRDAEAEYRKGLECDARCVAAHYNLGNLMRDAGRHGEAAQSFRAAVGIKPDHVDAWHSLGTVLQRDGKFAEAAPALERAMALKPERADLIGDLAMCRLAQDEGGAALLLMQKAVAVEPGLAIAHGNLGAVHLRAGRLVEAERATRRAMELAPDEARWVSNLGVISKDLGLFDEAEALFRRALDMRPGYALAHANLLFCVNYHPEKTAEEIVAEYRRFDAAHARPLMPGTPTYANDPTPARRLRVGYLSPDFREHAARYFLEPLLAHHDRDAIDLHCYAEVANPDAVTASFKKLAGHWRSTVGQSDEAVAEQIRKDGIDILVDFGGHTSSSRLLVMARRPAPIQIAHHLGHGYTSGLSAVDVFMSDAEMAPQGSEALFVERIVRLPRIPVAYVPPRGMAEVAPLPALARGGAVTFGYFGRPERLNARVIAAWSQILARVPGSRLMLNSKAFAEAAFCNLFADRFARHGIGRERLHMVYTSPQPRTWAAYGEIDIALDPFPHNAGTTTIEALWLGVPVVSVLDRPSVGRFGASTLGAAGLRDWVAETVADYVDLAVAKASDLTALARLRSGLRQRVAASPLSDGRGLARDMEQAFRDLWTDWCARQKVPAAEPAIELQRNEVSARVQQLDAEGKRTEAVALLIAHLKHDPPFVLGHCLLSDLYRRLGRLPEAEAAARDGLKASPGDASAANALGNALAARGRLGEAEAAFTVAIEAQSGNAEAYNNRALVLMRRGQLVAAERDLRTALAARPALAEIGFNLANAVQDQGRVADSLVEFRATLDKVPPNPTGHGMMLFAVTYHPGLSGEEIFDEFRRWNEIHAARFAPKNPVWPNARTRARRLRVGYVSPDFANKSSRHFIEPILVGHDRSRVETFCYAEVPAPDAETQRLKALAEHWRLSVGLSDDDLANLIRCDAIDVLVDLGGHTARNRLLMFARKPAPVQVAHFLGHGYTSGLMVMDAFLADAALVPPGFERLFSEPVVRMGRIPIAYSPPAAMPPVAPLPAVTRGHITFGNFGRAVRLNGAYIATVARILRALPTSRLVLNTVAFTDEDVRRRYRDLFAGHGIAEGRVDLVFTTPQPKTWNSYAGIDIALDAFPHNGGTTTIEALWLGVPSICMRTRPSVGCFGASIMGSVGLGDWVADNEDDYVALAVRRASDIGALAALRSTLRSRVAASPLCDARGLGAALEEIYGRLWQTYCDREARIDDLQARAAAEYRGGQPGRAAELFHAAADVAARPDILSNLGAALKSCGRYTEAEDAYREAVRRAPDFAAAHGNLGNLLADRGRLAEAEAALRRALELSPDDAQAMRNLGLALMRQMRHDQAQPLFERALTLLPDNGDLYDNLAQLLRQKGQPVAALKLYERAAGLIGDNWRALGNQALLLQDLGRFDEAERVFRRTLALKPDYALAHANLLFCVNYHPEKPAAEIFAEYRAYDAAHARRHMPAQARFDNDPAPGRRLRVGFLSPDFREHAARHFIEPLLAHIDRSAVELFCYAEVANPDRVTAEFQKRADHWRSTVALTDDEVAAMIRRDRIDVLMDFGGHTSSSRILAMARKPAPVQIAYLLGHGYTSGLTAMDAFLADEAMAPAGCDALFSERVVRLSRIPIAYAPPAGMPAVGPLPAKAKGHVTFGYFGRPERINDRVVAAWADILRRVPKSRLMLNSKAFSEEAFAVLMAGRFAAHGIGRDRLIAVYTSPQPRTWEAYGEVDIALDPFPHNAGTTTIEALWLGVPVVSLADRPSVGRFGASILGACGLSDWVAATPEHYVAMAVAKAGDIAGLVSLRAGLRARLAASPLCDGPGLARELVAAFRSLWKEHCAAGGSVPAPTLAAAVAAYQVNDFERAWACADTRLACAPDDTEARHLRGIAAYKLGRLSEAAEDVAGAVREQPGRADMRWNLVPMLKGLGRLKDAEVHGREAVRLAPDAPEAHNNLASVLKELGLADEAEAHYRRAVALRPSYADAWSNLAWTLSVSGHAREAESAARQALALQPRDANALNNLGTALMHQDRLREAGDCFEGAVALKPDFAVAHSNALFCLNYRTDLAAEAIFAAYRNWDAVHARPLMPAAPKFAGTKDPGRRLRVGYVSSDFRYHAVSFFIEPLIAAHDRAGFEITCYSGVSNPDAVTERFQRHADRWRPIVGLSDAAVADLVRADGIDILVDLSGHTAGNRLLAFARKPAPVQVAHMVGSGTTTGLDAIDVFLADGALVPRSAEHLFSERVERLSRIPLVYAPPDGMPEVAPLPALRNGYVTFGCFSRTARINAAVIGAWAGILHAIPNSRLVLNSKPFRESEGRADWQARFAAHGIDPARVDLVFTSPQPRTWEAYGRIDIALDPFPHNAGTTTIEALWLGVPVISLASRPPVGRFGAAILGGLGLDDWVADSVEGYMRRAVVAASDVSALAQLRAGLRARFAASPLGGDGASLAREVERVYRQSWKRTCASGS